MVKNEVSKKVKIKNAQNFKKVLDFCCEMCYTKDTKKKE